MRIREGWGAVPPRIGTRDLSPYKSATNPEIAR
jgi:hypothetical protein